MQKRNYTKEYKSQIVKEAIETGNCAVIARKHDMNPSMVSK